MLSIPLVVFLQQYLLSWLRAVFCVTYGPKQKRHRGIMLQQRLHRDSDAHAHKAVATESDAVQYKPLGQR